MNVVVGAGPAGLACARELVRRGQPVRLLEAENVPGGRLRTKVDGEGFVLDRGFQVLLEGYRATRSLVDWPELDPCYFSSGALIWNGERLVRLENPLRRPGAAWEALLEPLLPLGDKALLGLLALDVLLSSEEGLRRKAGRAGGESVREALERLGFSPKAFQAFFRPFFGGVLLDCELASDFQLLRLALRRFVLGRAFLPRGGIGKFPEHLAAKLPGGVLQTGAKAVGLERGLDGRIEGVRLAGGEVVRGEKFFWCVDVASSREVFPEEVIGTMAGRSWQGVETYYFEPACSLVEGPWLVLNGTGRGPVAHLCELSQVDSSVAPGGRSLLSVTVLGPSEEGAVRQQLQEIFSGKGELRLVEKVWIERAVPEQKPGFAAGGKPNLGAANFWWAGDQVGIASTEESILSGLDAAARSC